MRPSTRRGKVSHDRWLVSYADFITLLFGFFVVLYAFARADQKKQAQLPVAIDSAFHAMGVFPGKSTNPEAAPTSIVTGQQILMPGEVKRDLERIKHDLSQTLSGQISAHSVSITMSREGLVISLREAGFFNSGSAIPKAQAIDTLHQIASSLGRVPYDLRVEGHTDNVPIHNAAFDSNWELSSARATGIARQFLDWRAMSPERLSAAGYSEFHPVADNSSAEGRAQNRRVDIIVLPRTEIDFAAPSAPVDEGPWRRVTEEDQ